MLEILVAASGGTGFALWLRHLRCLSVGIDVAVVGIPNLPSALSSVSPSRRTRCSRPQLLSFQKPAGVR